VADAKPDPPTVVIVDSLQDTLDMLRCALENAGFRVVEAGVDDLRHAAGDLAAFAVEQGATVIVYDVSLPYETNWRTVQACLAIPALADVGFIVTTTNEVAIYDLVGPSDNLQVIGKPYELREVVEAVRRAARRGANDRRAVQSAMMRRV